MRLLDPSVLGAMSNLELVAKAVVEGFVIGLHRSPKFGFSQEFVEYRQYADGDDPRYIDWNVYSRTDRTVIKRFKGETNSHLMLLLDTSASMGYGSGESSKLQYGKYLGASLAYLAARRHDAVGVMLFDDEVKEYRPRKQTRFTAGCYPHAGRCPGFGRDRYQSTDDPLSRAHQKRGLVAVISDFYCDAEELLENIRPLALHGQDVIMFHLLDREEITPEIKQSTLYEDMETGQAIEVEPAFMQKAYRDKIQKHIASIEEAANGIRADHVLLDTSEPLDKALHNYLTFREKRG